MSAELRCAAAGGGDGVEGGAGFTRVDNSVKHEECAKRDHVGRDTSGSEKREDWWRGGKRLKRRSLS